MPRRKRSLTTPPLAWAASLEEHHHDLHRVRLLWRRGAVPYRPIVAEDLELEQLSEHDWIEYELPETHFEWDVGLTESPTERRDRIDAIIDDLWTIAIRWTRSRGEWCDFQLVGYDDDGETLFEDGRRCKVEDDPDSADADDVIHEADWSPRMTHVQPPRVTISPEWRELHKTHASDLKEIIDYTKTDRDDALSRSRQTLNDNQRLWHQVHEASQLANQVLRETVAYEREQAEQARNQNSGRLKLQAHAVSEMERSRRVADVLGFLKHGWDSAMANVVPVVRQVFESQFDRRAGDFPEFRWAQQAMAFLVLDLTETQLELMFKNNREAAGAFLGRLDKGASMKVERDALEHVAPVVRILRSERFRDLTRPEQQIAARFIIGRLATYRMAEYGEDEAAGATGAG